MKNKPSGLNTATEVAKTVQGHIYLMLFITFAAMHIIIYKIHVVNTDTQTMSKATRSSTNLFTAATRQTELAK